MATAGCCGLAMLCQRSVRGGGGGGTGVGGLGRLVAGRRLGGAAGGARPSPERVSRLVLVNSTPCFARRLRTGRTASPCRCCRGFAVELRRNHRACRAQALHRPGSPRQRARRLPSCTGLLRAMLFQHGEPEVSALEDGLADPGERRPARRMVRGSPARLCC
ncbi:MAG: hypothetical protein MZV65_41305 [Chromatiales bacterium]|nr:hypothetical protein [Chromatiales bacterium]